MANPDQDARSSATGEYVPSIDTARLDAEAAELRTQGYTLQQIADTQGIAVSTAHKRINRALDAVRSEPGERLQELELARLDALTREAVGVLQRNHVVVSHGKIITTVDPDTGKAVPLRDDGPTLQAIETLRRLSESRRKLLGLDAPASLSVAGSVTYELVGVDLELLK
jgi:hypothetical protein